VAEEGAASDTDGLEALDKVEVRRPHEWRQLTGPPVPELRGDGSSGGSVVEVPGKAMIGGIVLVEGLVVHKRLDLVQPHALVNEAG
jgi:hypothetical protein